MERKQAQHRWVFRKWNPQIAQSGLSKNVQIADLKIGMFAVSEVDFFLLYIFLLFCTFFASLLSVVDPDSNTDGPEIIWCKDPDPQLISDPDLI
jgi:hypothetical protein